MLSWLAAKGSSRRQDVWESGEFTPDFQELESGVLQHTSEWQGLSQEDTQDKRPKEMGSLEAQLAGLRQELVAISQRQAAMAQEIHLWREKMVALHSDVSPPVPWLSNACPLISGGLLMPGYLPRELQPSEVSTGHLLKIEPIGGHCDMDEIFLICQ
uniref:SUN domain-containing protein 2-like n=1 Tax=Phascolarctos cinereus TaxID=38626 RepID=A0A6P5JSN2_PHACI